ncbi:hypothetical protein AAG570_006321 [Ranatra chinensis]|uniref:Uncharacterized protein n=1 Tax=Ranatra chinensis TaxID=642074 RepID=A0ABD0YTM9_9HEMI
MTYCISDKLIEGSPTGLKNTSRLSGAIGSRRFRTEFLQELPTPGTGPSFDTTVPNNITGLVGKTAYLNCRVKNLGNKTLREISSTFSEGLPYHLSKKTLKLDMSSALKVSYPVDDILAYFQAYCANTIVTLAEDGVLAPKHVLPEQKAGDDGNWSLRNGIDKWDRHSFGSFNLSSCVHRPAEEGEGYETFMFPWESLAPFKGTHSLPHIHKALASAYTGGPRNSE